MNFVGSNIGQLGEYFKHRIFYEKLDNWFGYVYAAAGGLFFAYLFSSYGMKLGSLLIGLMVGVPLAFVVIFNPRFGVVFVIVTSYVLLGIKRLSPEFPLGILVDFMVVFLAFGIFYNNLYQKEWSFARGNISKMVLLYMAFVFLSFANPQASCKLCFIYTIRSMAGYMIMYFIVAYVIRTKKDVLFFLKLWLFMSLLAALYAFKQEYLGLAGFEDRWLHEDPTRFWLLFQWGRLRKWSFMADPTSFGINMAYTMLIAIVLLFSNLATRKKLLLLALVIIMGQAMLFSGTRSAYVVIPIGLVLFLTLIKKKKIYLIAALGAVFFVGLIFAPIRNPTIIRFQSAFKPGEDKSFQVRQQNQQMIRPWIWRHPLGGGLGATGVWGERFAPNSFLAGFPPDSGLVRNAVELGWVGLTLYMMLWLVIFKQGIDSYFNIRDPLFKMVALSMLCVMFGLFVVNYAQDALKQLPTSLLFWIAAAIISRTSQIEEDELLKKA